MAARNGAATIQITRRRALLHEALGTAYPWCDTHSTNTKPLFRLLHASHHEPPRNSVPPSTDFFQPASPAIPSSTHTHQHPPRLSLCSQLWRNIPCSRRGTSRTHIPFLISPSHLSPLSSPVLLFPLALVSLTSQCDPHTHTHTLSVSCDVYAHWTCRHITLSI